MKTTYWISTILFIIMMLMGVGQYFFKTDAMRELFVALSYPAYIVIPLGIVKLLGIIGILSKKCRLLKEWAYAGFFYVLILAIMAHALSGVPSVIPAFSALVLLIISYLSDKKLSRRTARV